MNLPSCIVGKDFDVMDFIGRSIEPGGGLRDILQWFEEWTVYPISELESKPVAQLLAIAHKCFRELLIYSAEYVARRLQEVKKLSLDDPFRRDKKHQLIRYGKRLVERLALYDIVFKWPEDIERDFE